MLHAANRAARESKCSDVSNNQVYLRAQCVPFIPTSNLVLAEHLCEPTTTTAALVSSACEPRRDRDTESKALDGQRAEQTIDDSYNNVDDDESIQE